MKRASCLIRNFICHRRALALVLILVAGLLQACGGSGGDGSTENASAAGYYNNGTGSISDPVNAGTTLNVNDMQALVSGNRLMMMSVASGLFYDVNLTVTGNDYSASGKLYYGMGADPRVTVIPAPVSVSLTGQITAGSRITGTVAGTVAGSGSFNLVYSQTNNTAASSANVAKGWRGPINNYNDMQFDFALDSAGTIVFNALDSASQGIFQNCRLAGAVLPLTSESLFALSLALSSCDNIANDGSYRGFATTTDASHNYLVLMFSNGTVSGHGVLLNP